MILLNPKCLLVSDNYKSPRVYCVMIIAQYLVYYFYLGSLPLKWISRIQEIISIRKVLREFINHLVFLTTLLVSAVHQMGTTGIIELLNFTKVSHKYMSIYLNEIHMIKIVGRRNYNMPKLWDRGNVSVLSAIRKYKNIELIYINVTYWIVYSFTYSVSMKILWIKRMILWTLQVNRHNCRCFWWEKKSKYNPIRTHKLQIHTYM